MRYVIRGLSILEGYKKRVSKNSKSRFQTSTPFHIPKSKCWLSKSMKNPSDHVQNNWKCPTLMFLQKHACILFTVFRGACLSSTGLVSHSVCLLSSVCLSSVKLFQILQFVQFFQVLSNSVKSFQVLSGPFKSFQVLSSLFMAFQVFPSPFKSLQVLSNPFKSFQFLSSPFMSFPVLPSPSYSLQVLSSLSKSLHII